VIGYVLSLCVSALSITFLVGLFATAGAAFVRVCGGNALGSFVGRPLFSRYVLLRA
jgi:hypothetical protein